MIFEASPKGLLMPDGHRFKAVFGRGGFKPDAKKEEGDEASPIGIYPLRRVLYRADRLSAPRTALSIAPLAKEDGWCDAVDDVAYNQPVTHPYHASAEHLWRDDELYDVLVVLGHNDNPVVPGKGSAIFLHCARADFRPTLGCVALARQDLLQLLELAKPGDMLKISDT